MTVDATQTRHNRTQRICLDLMYSQTRAAWGSNAFCVVLLWIAFWNNANHAWLLGWTSVGVLIMAMREIQSRRYATLAGQAINIKAWTRWLDISLFANGCLWGIGCATLTLVATPYQLPVIVLIAGGLQTGSVLSSSYRLTAFALFSVPLFLFTLVAFLVLGFSGERSLLVTAALLVVWSIFILVCASRFGKHYRRSVGYALENLDLAESLKFKNQENETLNESLRERIDELNETQRQLLIEKRRSDGLVRQLTELSTTDGLTGLHNRRSFDERLRSEWRRAKRNNQPIALIMADVDHFKAYNDRYGHPKGDDCLIQVAEVLSGAAGREGDWAVRHGGEEFALILANTTLEDAIKIAERIRQGVLDCAVEHETSPIMPQVSLSLGVAEMMPDESREPKALVAAADAALYEAKRKGRNCVVSGGAFGREHKQLA